MWRCCKRAERDGLPIFLYGGRTPTLEHLRMRLAREFPHLYVAGMYSPPFRILDYVEDAQVVETIRNSGARIVFVGLGCPKQEIWMATHRGAFPAVMIGVGAAFEFLAGTLPRAPAWMKKLGLEWLHRLLSEPRRFWRRYLVTNTLYLYYLAAEILAHPGQRARPDLHAPS